MHIGLLSAVLIAAAVIVGWLAVGSCACLAVRRRRRRDAEWEEIVVHLRDVEADLEWAWLSEISRIWPYR